MENVCLKLECPQCLVERNFTTLAGFKYALTTKCVCGKCREQNKHINCLKRTGYFRKCKCCGIIHRYKSHQASKSSKPCKKCSSKLRRKDGGPGFDVFCKKCGKFRNRVKTRTYQKHYFLNTLCRSCSKTGIPSPNKGIKLSEEIKSKMRLTTRLKCIEKIRNLKGNITPNYNKKACEFFNELNKKLGCNIQHAENGGEYYIKELGYWLDGYDKEHNVVYEWYEKFHFRFGKLKYKDVIRKNDIIKLLKCNVIGYNDDGIELFNESYTEKQTCNSSK